LHVFGMSYVFESPIMKTCVYVVVV
jgi:hypothetical protein